MKRTTEKIIAAAEARGRIEENEILLPKRIENPIPVSCDQAQKGFARLWDKYRTPRGAERKNNPFSNPEEKALEWAKMHGARFTYEPIYELIAPICDIQYIASLGQFQRV